jgi:hypothetical protein
MMPQDELFTHPAGSKSSRFSIQKLFQLLVLKSAWTWTLFLMLMASIGGFLIGWGAYVLANAGLFPLVYLWDNWVLMIYATIEFQYVWWVFVISGVVALLVFFKPWNLYVQGGWCHASISFILTGLILFTIFIVLSWQLKVYIIHSSWVFNKLESIVPISWKWGHWFLKATRPWFGVAWWTLIITLFSMACWGYLFGFGLLKNITHRIPAINLAYIRHTRWIIKNEKHPLDCIFSTSLYSTIVRQLSGPLVSIPRKLFQPILPQRKLIERFFFLFEKFVMVLVHYLSLSWIADRLFGKPYYSMHLEIVLTDLLTYEQHKVWNVLEEDYVHGALETYAWDGMFAEDTGEAL